MTAHKKLSQGDQTVLQEDIFYLARMVNDWHFFNPNDTPPTELIKRVSKNIHMRHDWRALAVHYNLNIPANLIHTLSPTQRIIWTLSNPYHHLKHPYKQELGAHVIRAVLTAMAVAGYGPPPQMTNTEERFFNTVKEEVGVHATRI